MYGQSLGRFAIQRWLGSGAMGEVYLAHDPRSGRQVALKRLAPFFRDNEQYRQRLRREAERVSRLENDHITKIYECLENAIERAIALGSTDEVSIEDLPDDVVEASTRHRSMLLESLKATKADRVRQAMDQARGNYAEAARLLGIHVNALHRIIRNLGLRSQIRAVRVHFTPSDIDE
jgi:serine/threonine protein kinase